MWLAPVDAAAIELRADNGQVVDVAKKYGTFVDGRNRFYSSQWGYLTAEKAKRIQGHRFVPRVREWQAGGGCEPGVPNGRLPMSRTPGNQLFVAFPQSKEVVTLTVDANGLFRDPQGTIWAMRGPLDRHRPVGRVRGVPPWPCLTGGCSAS